MAKLENCTNLHICKKKKNKNKKISYPACALTPILGVVPINAAKMQNTVATILRIMS